VRRALLIAVPLAALAVLAVVALVTGGGGSGGSASDGPMTVIEGRLTPAMDGPGYSIFLHFRPPDVPAGQLDPLTAPGLHIKTACRVGDRVLADNGLWFGELHHHRDLPDGVEENLAFSGDTTLPDRPDRCEVALHRYKGIDPTPEIRRFCLAGGETASEGPCVPPVVDHPPTGTDPILSEVSATIGKYGLVIGWTITAVSPPNPDWNVEFAGQCETDSGLRGIESGCSPMQSPGELEPGESVHCAQIGMQASPGSVSRCQIEFRTSVRATPSPTPFATYCMEVGGVARPGACP
jgi:hypothetical protein